MVEVPDVEVLVVLLKGHGVAVRDVDDALGHGAEQHADNTLFCVLGDAVVVIDN